jgi:hypothetical protein
LAAADVAAAPGASVCTRPLERGPKGALLADRRFCFQLAFAVPAVPAVPAARALAEVRKVPLVALDVAFALALAPARTAPLFSNAALDAVLGRALPAPFRGTDFFVFLVLDVNMFRRSG